jgi:Ca-activated chloride channel family protein
MADEIQLKATLHRAAYQVMSTPQQAYILLEATPTHATGKSVVQALNFSLVLDRSGSMAGSKLHHLKEAARQIVDRLGPGDLLSVVVFDDTAETVVSSGPVADRQQIKQKVEAIQERGGTHMSSGIRAGLKELQRGQSAGRVNGMLLLTDGQTWEDQAQCQELADQCRAAGVPITVLGLGVGEEGNWDPRLLEDLAQRSGGDWIVVDAPDKVANAFTHTLQELQGAAVTNATLTLRMVQGISPRTVWRCTPLISRLDHHAVSTNDIQVFLGDIPQQPGQALLADLLLPPRRPGNYRLMQADISYDVPSSGLTHQRSAVDIVVGYTDDPLLPNQTNQRVMNIAERVMAHKLQTQALDEAAMGDRQRATQRLRAAATRLLELGEAELAQQATQQAERIEQSGQVDPAAAQRMRYATKRLTETGFDD